MPLVKGKSKKVIAHGKPPKVAVATANSEARKSHAKPSRKDRMR